MYNIVHYPNPILRQKTEEVPEITTEIKEICKIMLDRMYTNRGVGLAAPQIGLSHRIFVVNYYCNSSRKDKEFVFINPKIIHLGTRFQTNVEGCLSLPGINVSVSRPHKILFSALDLEGKEIKYAFEGMMGRICQHEYDHLESTLIIDKMDEKEKSRISPIIQKLELSL